MNLLHASVVLSVLLATLLARAADQLSPELQRGLFEEEANQNFEAAIKAYQSVLGTHDDERKLAATALFRLGECYRKLGRTKEAATQYQRLIAEFADQATLANLSRQNLVGLGVRTTPDRAGDSSDTANQVLLQQRALAAEMAEAAQSESLVKQLTNRSRLELRRILPTVAPDALLNSLLQQLSQEEQTLSGLSATYTANHPEVKAERDKIAVLNSQIDDRIDGIMHGLKLKADALAQRSETLKRELAGPPSTRRDNGAGDDSGRADPAARAQLRELLQSEIKIAEQFAAEQRKKVEVGTLAKGDEVRFERDVLNLKRQLVATDGLSSVEDRNQWRELLLQEIKLAEEAARSERQKLDNGRSVASAVAPLQRDVLILKRELISFDTTPAPSAATGAARPGYAQRLQAVVSAPTTSGATDEEEKEIRRIQALIKDSPDLINASGTDWTPLHQAATRGQLVVARFLLENGAGVDQKTSDGRGSALLLAAGQGHKSMVELLLAKGANPNVKDQSGTTALHEAAAKGFVSVVEVLLASKADLESRNSSDETPLHRAVTGQQTAVVEALLKRGADVNAQRNNGDTPLHFAAVRGDTRLIALLLERKADINLKNRAGTPPLWVALDQGRVEAVRMLLEQGARTDFTVGGSSLMHRAANLNSIELVRLLIERKAPPDLPNRSGLTPLQAVVLDHRITANPDLVAMLVKAGANPNRTLPESAQVQTRDPNTGSTRELSVSKDPLLIAALLARNPPMVEALLENGAQVNSASGGGNTALMYASSGPVEIVDTMLRHKPDLELKTEADGRTALQQAVLNKNLKAVEAMIKAGASIDARDRNGWTALHHAAWIGDSPIAELLLAAGAGPNIQTLDGRLPLAIARDPQVPSGANRPEVARILLQHGADESLLRRQSITVTRRNRNHERIVFRKGTNDFNRFSLYELMSTVYFLGSQKPGELAFPDLRQLAIERYQPGSSRQILVDLEARTASADCTNDLWLEWGDAIEIRETEHPLYANWPGLDGTMATNISQCLGRTVHLIIKGRTNRIDLRAGAAMSGQTTGVGGFINGFHIGRDSFHLSEVLQRSGLLLTTSDLTRVRVRRGEPLKEWILNETKPDSQTDFWLRDGDVIEVPDRPFGEVTTEPNQSLPFRTIRPQAIPLPAK